MCLEIIWLAPKCWGEKQNFSKARSLGGLRGQDTEAHGQSAYLLPPWFGSGVTHLPWPAGWGSRKQGQNLGVASWLSHHLAGKLLLSGPLSSYL